MKQKPPPIKAVVERVDAYVPGASIDKQQMDVIHDIYENWRDFYAGIHDHSLRILAGPAFLQKHCQKYAWNYCWKWLSLLAIAIGLLLLFFDVIGGLLILILALIALRFLEGVRQDKIQTFTQRIRTAVGKGSQLEGMVVLIANYLSGTIHFGSNRGKAGWPQCPSRLLTGKKRFS